MSDEASKTVLGYQFPNGHLGHLTPEHKSSLDAFRALVTERGVYQPATSDRLPSHGDATLLRFLRARKFQLEPAYKQFIEAEKWASDNRIAELYETIDVDEYEATRKLYPQWVGTRDKRGMPVYLYLIGPLDMKAVFAYEKAKTVKGATGPDRPAPAKMLRVFALYENLCRFTTPWCTALEDRSSPNAPITQGCNIIDIKGTGLKQFWDLKNHLQDSSQLATAYYPETLDKIFIIGAPSFFPSVWGWIKNWFDPVVVSKMFVIPSGQELKVLSEHIDHDAIPKRYGGGADYAFGDLPKIEPAMRGGLKWENGMTGLPIGPVKWETSADGELVAVAVGTVEGQARRQVVGRLDKSFRKTFYRTQAEAEGAAGLDGVEAKEVPVDATAQNGAVAA